MQEGWEGEREMETWEVKAALVTEPAGVRADGPWCSPTASLAAWGARRAPGCGLCPGWRGGWASGLLPLLKEQPGLTGRHGGRGTGRWPSTCLARTH